MGKYGDRPKNPDALLRAARKVFGTACLAWGTTRPRPELAHICDWPTVRLATESAVRGIPERIAHVGKQHRRSTFHDLGNVVPLCPNHHTLFDGNYPEFDVDTVLALRDAALRNPEVLLRVVDVIIDELRGRPNRWIGAAADGCRKYNRATDLTALITLLSWVRKGFGLGLELGEPHLVVDCVSGGQHYHVALDHGAVDHCAGDSSQCATARTRTVRDTAPQGR
ncbi:HNH endonuclease [Streptomyces sp. C11-1]|uniref:HNH endonuclease n=1 Tax=Streptomyces durocortorensis TaxID=2811104 RepID=A0ABY9W514_9ACTN|nr:HNH endonuclease [Streptomyces durocortorensis]WNF31093.1 HNH endonuclease [Streptomyces durocortorensis]